MLASLVTGRALLGLPARQIFQCRPIPIWFSALRSGRYLPASDFRIIMGLKGKDIMFLFSISALAFMALMRFGPDIPFIRMLNTFLLEWPLGWIASHNRHHAVQLAILLILCLGSWELVLMFGSEFAWIYAGDLALYLDVLVMSFLMTAQGKIKIAYRMARHIVSKSAQRVWPRVRTSSRETITRRSLTGESDNDDEGASPPLALAA